MPTTEREASPPVDAAQGDAVPPEPDFDGEFEPPEEEPAGPAPEPDFDGEFEPPEEEPAGPAPEPDFDGEFQPRVDEPAGPPPEPEGIGGDAGPDFEDYDPVRDSPEWAKATGWSRAGIVALATGTALVIGGLAMGLSDPGAPGAGNNNFVDARNRAALIMGVPGGLLIAGGAAMLAHGERSKKRLLLGASPSVARSAGGAPAITGLGFHFSGRF